MYATWTLLIIAFDVTLLTLLKGTQVTVSRSLRLLNFLFMGLMGHEHERMRSRWRKVVDGCVTWGEFQEAQEKWERSFEEQSAVKGRPPALRKTWSVSDLPEEAMKRLPDKNQKPLMLDEKTKVRKARVGARSEATKRCEFHGNSLTPLSLSRRRRSLSTRRWPGCWLARRSR